jgi:hypothetical protein
MHVQFVVVKLVTDVTICAGVVIVVPGYVLMEVVMSYWVCRPVSYVMVTLVEATVWYTTDSYMLVMGIRIVVMRGTFPVMTFDVTLENVVVNMISLKLSVT